MIKSWSRKKLVLKRKIAWGWNVVSFGKECCWETLLRFKPTKTQVHDSKVPSHVRRLTENVLKVSISFVNPSPRCNFYDHSHPKHSVTLFVNCCLMQPRPEYFDLVCSMFSSPKYLLNPGRDEKTYILAPTELLN